MFLAIRDLWWARGRFALMVTAVALITALVVMLSGLTEGLSRQSISAVTSLPSAQIAFERPGDGQSLSFNSSRVTPQQVQTARAQSGVTSADPLGIATTRATVGGSATQVTIFGVDPGSAAAPRELLAGNTVVSRDFAEEHGLRVGDQVTVGDATLRVAALADNASFSHLPVLWVPRTVWAATGGASGAGSVLLVDTASGFDRAAFDAATGLSAQTPKESLSAIGSYSAENGSLTMIRVLLIAISALVIGAFFTVWTVQRETDLAVLKAIGAKTSYLVGDALGQALLTLLIGGLIGATVAVAAGLAVAGTVPVVIEVATVLNPLILLLVVGLIGAAAALRRVITVDPMNALAGAR